MAEIKNIYDQASDPEGLHAKLRISEEQFRGAFEHAAIGMAIVSPDGKWVQVNNSLSKMLGYSPTELPKLTFQDVTHPEDLNKDLSAVKKLILGKKNSYKMEKRYFHKNGGIIYAILSVSIVRDVFGQPLHFVSQIIDISDIKKTENHLEIERRVTNDQNKRLLNFAHIVSHNLRSHSGNLQMLLSFMDVEKDESARNELFGMFHQAAANLEDTITHLTEVVSMKNTFEEGLKVLNLKSVINDAVGNVHALLRKTSGKCKVELEEDLYVKVIPAYLDSIVLNLLTNSIKYRSKDRPLEIYITGELLQDMVVLSIKDNGSGIDLHKNGDQIFGMYKTFHANPDARGIGLFITKNQVEAMGGRITVESEPEVGSLFKVYLKA